MARPQTDRTVVRAAAPSRPRAGLCAARSPAKACSHDRTPHDIAGLWRASGPIQVETHPALVKQKSRDFFWYSPILKRQLDHLVAELVVTPARRGEVVETLAAAHALGIPVTPRGSGTGNYGQAMPLDGGIILNLAEMTSIAEIAPGRLRCEPGAVMADIDRHTRPHSGQELRMHPSTYNTASLGGFIAGGSGGVGSINWGGLRDLGNILSVTVATMEASPRLLRLSGEDLPKVAHAYGTNGIITEVEMPLAPAYDWVDVIVGFASFDGRPPSATLWASRTASSRSSSRRSRRRCRSAISCATRAS